MDWLFQCNPKRYPLASKIEAGASGEDWAMNQHKERVSPGDRVFLWETGKEARLLVVGHTTSFVNDRKSSFGDHYVDIVFDYKIVPPLTRPEALANETLAKFAPFTGPGARGTNFPIDDPSIVAALDQALERRLVPYPGIQLHESHDGDLLKSLIKARDQLNDETTTMLRNYIANMDPTAFEWLVAALFVKLGCKSVDVTKQSGDGGIDVRATLAAGGVANIKIGIQAKRHSGVGRPVVNNLRGSLGPHDAGFIVASGQFTSEAIEEAKDPIKTPIALVNGSQLVQLILKHEIGVKKHNDLTYYSLKLDELSMERLKAYVEEHDDTGS